MNARSMKPMRALPLLLTFFLAACQSNLRDQPRYDPLEASEFFQDGRSARPLPPNTVPRGVDVEDEGFYSGRDLASEDSQAWLREAPIALTLDILEKGRAGYDAFCSPCHGLDGYGEGMIVQRGFSRPPSLHSDRLREVEDGYLFDVISNGFGRMYAYAGRIEPAERWAIVGYMRALQLSQNAPLEAAPPDALEELESQP